LIRIVRPIMLGSEHAHINLLRSDPREREHRAAADQALPVGEATGGE